MKTIVEKVSENRANLTVMISLCGPYGAGTGREVSRRAGMSHQWAHVVLGRLVSAGVVRRMPVGPAYLFSLEDGCETVVKNCARNAGLVL